ncbi:MAG TPA: hypothetical protein VGP93_09630 [Polyangiaceae bacterium]|jgi:hypothetical protein|nr:hypothetical protein [Polyangiaceae bacterium]
MDVASSEEVQDQEEKAADTLPPSPDSGRRPRPREQLATLPGDSDFEHHDTIPAPPWQEEPTQEGSRANL